MDERENYPIDEIEIDIGRIFLAIMNRGWLMILVAVLCAVLVFGGTVSLIPMGYSIQSPAAKIKAIFKYSS